MSEFKTRLVRGSLINDFVSGRIPAICVETVIRPQNYSPLHRRLARIFHSFTPNDKMSIRRGQCRPFGVGGRRFVLALYTDVHRGTTPDYFDKNVVHSCLTEARKSLVSLGINSDFMYIQRLGSRKNPVPMAKVLEALDEWASLNKVIINMYVPEIEA